MNILTWIWDHILIMVTLLISLFSRDAAIRFQKSVLSSFVNVCPDVMDEADPFYHTVIK